MTKREKLEKLDDEVLDKMLDIMKSGKTEELRDLNVCVTFLKNNQVLTPPKEKSTAHENIANVVK